MPPTPAKFVQIHALQEFNAVLLNTDSSGMAKRVLVGGAIRTRISSQCIKWHYRKHDGPFSFRAIAPDPVRTKELSEAAILSAVNAGLGEPLDDATAAAVISALNLGLYGKENGNDPKKRQLLLFGVPEVEFLARRAAELLGDRPDADEATRRIAGLFDAKAADNFVAFRQALALPAGVEGAAWGRVVTSDSAASITGAIGMGHPFTTHTEENSVDFLVAMDDLNTGPGAGFMNQGSELNSGIYYVNVWAEIPSLVANTTGHPAELWTETDRTIAAEITARLAGMVATVSPRNRRSGTAAAAYAAGMMVEIGEWQPRSLGGAFRQPTEPNMPDAKNRLSGAVDEWDDLYGVHEQRRWLGFRDQGREATRLDELVDWIRQAVLDGEAA